VSTIQTYSYDDVPLTILQFVIMPHTLWYIAIDFVVGKCEYCLILISQFLNSS
jgi:hypothetical protein